MNFCYVEMKVSVVGRKGSGTALGQLPSGLRPILHPLEMQASRPSTMQLFGCPGTFLSGMGWATRASGPGCQVARDEAAHPLHKTDTWRPMAAPAAAASHIAAKVASAACLQKEGLLQLWGGGCPFYSAHSHCWEIFFFFFPGICIWISTQNPKNLPAVLFCLLKVRIYLISGSCIRGFQPA